MAEYAVIPGGWQGLTPILYGYEACTPEHCFGPAVRHYYLLHYVLQGEGKFETKDGVYTVRKGDIFVIRPDEVTTYGTGREDPWQYSWVGLDVVGAEPEFLRQPVLRQPPVRQIFAYIRDHHMEEGLDGKIYSLVYDLFWQLSRREGSRTGSYAAYAKAYLDTSYMQQVSIQALADSLHIDRRYLTIQFRQTYGIPPQKYLMELRLEKARQFIQGGHSVTDAAALAGFTDLSNFSRQFREHYGVSPSRGKKKADQR